MNKMKYIRFENNYGGNIFIVFSGDLIHKDVGRMTEIQNPDLIAISAGFVGIGSRVSCYGESISMRLKSKPEDSELLQNQFNQ